MRTYRSHINLAIALVSFALTPNVANAQTFNETAGTYSWTDNPKWTPATFPNLANASATFNGVSGNLNVTLDQLAGITVGSISITNDNMSGAIFTLSNGSSSGLTFNSGGSSSFSVSGLNSTANHVSVAASITLADALTITNSSSGSTAFVGNITGIGSIVKEGSGLVTFSGVNGYVGGTTINSGTLALGSSGAIGSTGTITFGGGTLQYSGANTTDYSDRFSVDNGQHYRIDTNGQTVTFADDLISDGGSLTKLGSGTLILTGANTYTGGTTISGGILQFSNEFNSGDITNNGSLIFSLATQTSFDGVISGTGTVTITGNHIFAFSGENTYTGVTTIQSGTTLEIVGAGTIVGDVTNNGTLNFFKSSESIFTFGGHISGGGDVEVGSGSVTLTGNSTVVTVRLTSSGSLFVAGNLEATSSFSHTGSGVLGGSETITTPLLTVQNNSVIRGGTPGTTGMLTIAGNLTLGASGEGLGAAILQVEASRTGEGAADASKINVTGAAKELNLYTGLVIEIVNGASPLQPLQVGETYTITLASVGPTGNIKFDTISLTHGTEIDLSKYTVTGSDFTPTGTILSIDGTNLKLTFTVSPVPEPGAVLGIAVGALAIGGLVRRRLRKPAVATAAVAV